MSNVGQKERQTQDRVIKLFTDRLNYRYLGDWQYQPDNRNIETAQLTQWLTRRGVDPALIKKALYALGKAAALGEGRNL